MKLLDWLLRRRSRRRSPGGDPLTPVDGHAGAARKGEDTRTARLAALKEFGNVTPSRAKPRDSVGAASGERAWPISLRISGTRSGRSAAARAIRSSSSRCWRSALAPISRCFRFNALALKPIPRVNGSASLGVLVARTDAGRILPLSYPDFRDLREQGRAFTGLAGTSMDAYSLGLGTHGERVFGELVTGNYSCVSASLGRRFNRLDDLTWKACRRRDLGRPLEAFVRLRPGDRRQDHSRSTPIHSRLLASPSLSSRVRSSASRWICSSRS